MVEHDDHLPCALDHTETLELFGEWNSWMMTVLKPGGTVRRFQVCGRKDKPSYRSNAGTGP
jgi:hypothetical protein